jgi:hypothetical protein
MNRPLTCPQARQLLLAADIFEPALSQQPDLLAHLQNCPECQATAHTLTRLDAAVRALPQPPGPHIPNATFLEKVRSLESPETLSATPRSQRIYWIRRALAAALLILVGLAALTLCLSTQTPVRASTVLDNLVAWNLALNQTHDPATRATLYAQRAPEMKRQVAQASWDAADRKLAEALLANADWLATPCDPLDAAGHFAVLADEISAQEQTLSNAANRAAFARWRQLISQTIQADLQKVDPSQLSPAQREHWDQLRPYLPPSAPGNDHTPPTGEIRGGTPLSPSLAFSTLNPTYRSAASNAAPARIAPVVASDKWTPRGHATSIRSGPVASSAAQLPTTPPSDGSNFPTPSDIDRRKISSDDSKGAPWQSPDPNDNPKGAHDPPPGPGPHQPPPTVEPQKWATAADGSRIAVRSDAAISPTHPGTSNDLKPFDPMPPLTRAAANPPPEYFLAGYPAPPWDPPPSNASGNLCLSIRQDTLAWDIPLPPKGVASAPSLPYLLEIAAAHAYETPMEFDVLEILTSAALPVVFQPDAGISSDPFMGIFVHSDLTPTCNAIAVITIGTTPTPEPAFGTSLLIGFGAFLLARRRKADGHDLR